MFRSFLLMTETVRISEVSEFDDATAKALGTGKPVIIYCYGNWKEGTCDSWCPDCVDGLFALFPFLLVNVVVVADGIIKKKAKECDAILIEVLVGDRDRFVLYFAL